MKKLFSILAILGLWVNLSMAQSTAKKAKDKVAADAVKLKKDGTPDQRYNNAKDAAKEKAQQAKTTTRKTVAKEAAASPVPGLKKDGTPDKRYTVNKEKAEAPVKASKKEVAAVKTQTKTVTAVVEDYKPTVDRSLKGPNGEQILNGPRGGKYYINKNGNKTYIKKEAE